MMSWILYLQNLDEYFTKMKELSEMRGLVSSRVRFMLRDVIDLRKNMWIPRRNVSNPMTMEQIQKEVEKEKETSDQQLLLSSAPPAPRLQDDRVQSNRRNSEYLYAWFWTFFTPFCWNFSILLLLNWSNVLFYLWIFAWDLSPLHCVCVNT